MNYIIFDLEWNNAYSPNKKKPINEIIEIGAIKLDEKLDVVDTFKQLIKPAISKKLSSYCAKLTNITMQEIEENGLPFKEVFTLFSNWSSGEDNVFLSWSNSDLYVLQQNFIQFFATSKIHFLSYYCDAQKYCMSFIEDDNITNQQISLSNCAKAFEIEFDSTNLHRALADCYLTAECLKKVYDARMISGFVNKCDDDFFGRLNFKPYFLSEPISEYCNIFEIEYICPNCGNNLTIVNDFKYQNKAFSSLFKCKECKGKYWGFIRVKKTYDDIKISKRFVPASKHKKY